MKTGPTINRGNSKQDYETPADFIAAVTDRFGALDFDLAADEYNAKAPAWYNEQDDALTQDWCRLTGNLWLNPPFGTIGPWARKCCLSAEPGKRRIFFLAPASVGSNWFAQYVHNRSQVIFLQPRLVFVGHSECYPKDLLLCCYGLSTLAVGYEAWRWR